jgi:hypothetical protein
MRHELQISLLRPGRAAKAAKVVGSFRSARPVTAEVPSMAALMLAILDEDIRPAKFRRRFPDERPCAVVKDQGFHGIAR